MNGAARVFIAAGALVLAAGVALREDLRVELIDGELLKMPSPTLRSMAIPGLALELAPVFRRE